MGESQAFPWEGKAWDFRFQGIRSTLDSHEQLTIIVSLRDEFETIL